MVDWKRHILNVVYRMQDAPWIGPLVAYLLLYRHRRLKGTRGPRIRRIVRPVTFSDKVTRKLLLDRRPILFQTADKVAARRYVADKVGEHVLVHLHLASSDPNDIVLSDLPDQFFMKSNHSSGHMRPVPDKRLVTQTQLRQEASDWLSSVYGRTKGEWWYGHIPPKVMIEEYLGGPDGTPPQDYRFHVMNGRVRVIQVDTDRFTPSTRRDFFTPNWAPIDVAQKFPQSETKPARPPQLPEMIAIAEALGVDTDYVRVDLYALESRIVFGELTHSPTGGAVPFDDESFDRWLGSLWDQPRRYR